jgi:two-component system, chemotaxis family, protein-glutamate methylesterase/glutaminase
MPRAHSREARQCTPPYIWYSEHVILPPPSAEEIARHEIPSKEYAAFDLIVVAASAGGVEALSVFLAGLPAYLPVPVIVVQHLPDKLLYASVLDHVLERKTFLRVKWAQDGECLSPGTVYIAPQNQHTVLHSETGLLHVTSDAGPDRIRPTADPLFRSAAQLFGSRVLAVVLSGALSDGAAGAAEIARAGGRVLAQASLEAQFPDMPLAAMQRSRVGLAFTANALAHIVGSLVMAPGAAKWFGVGKLGVGLNY